MKLYLMRHGHAQSSHVDPQKGLSTAGIAEVKQITEKLADRNVLFGQVIHSNKARAQQTAELVRNALSANAQCVESEHITPNDDPDIILNTLSDWVVDTLIVSHLPFIPELLHRLCPAYRIISFETATIVCLEKKGTAWNVLWAESP